MYYSNEKLELIKMKITFLFVGKTKDSWIKEGENEFLKRLQKFAQIEVKIVDELGKSDENKIKKEEGGNILKNIKNEEFLCLLDVKGKHLSSEELAKNIELWKDTKGGKIIFVVGGAYGVSEEVVKRADFLLSFSKMTLTHQMIRLFLMEQTYRAFSILGGSKYHK